MQSARAWLELSDSDEGRRFRGTDSGASSRVSLEICASDSGIAGNRGLSTQPVATQPHLDLGAIAHVPPPRLSLRVGDEDRQHPAALCVHHRDRETTAAASTSEADEQERPAQESMSR
jgi:hypothetical protein